MSLMWLICAVLTMPIAVRGLFLFFEDQEYRNGKLRFKSLDPMSWVLGIILGSVVSLAWPFVLTAAAVRYGLRFGTRHDRRRELTAHRNEIAYKKLKEARSCLLRQKKTTHEQLASEWQSQFIAADAERRAAIVKLREKQRLDEARERVYRDIERERMYADARGYIEDSYCPHGHSHDYPCSYCTFS